VAAAVVRRFRWIRWVLAGFLAIIGVVFLGSGIANLTAQGWAKATGTIGQCSTTAVNAGTGPPRQFDKICDVTWSVDGATHTASIDLGTGSYVPGQTVQLRVSGGNARQAAPVWVGIASTAGGVVLIGVGVVVMLRRRRA
jgi:hypothetical protein